MNQEDCGFILVLFIFLMSPLPFWVLDSVQNEHVPLRSCVSTILRTYLGCPHYLQATNVQYQPKEFRHRDVTSSISRLLLGSVIGVMDALSLNERLLRELTSSCVLIQHYIRCLRGGITRSSTIPPSFLKLVLGQA